MILTKDIEYSVIIISCLKNQTRPVKLEDIAKSKGLSLHFLEQVARKLRIAGYVKSVRGPGGGYIKTDQQATIGSLLKAKHKVKSMNVLEERMVNALNSIAV